jgi:hypothetical protein
LEVNTASISAVHIFGAGDSWHPLPPGLTGRQSTGQRGPDRRLRRAGGRAAQCRPGQRPTRVGFLGVGLIARYIHTYLAPHVTGSAAFDHNALVLHVSLRDLAPEIILRSANIVDDVEHRLKANTSVHLAEQQVGNRDFLDGTLHDVVRQPQEVRRLIAAPASTPLWTKESPAGRNFSNGLMDLSIRQYRRRV